MSVGEASVQTVVNPSARAMSSRLPPLHVDLRQCRQMPIGEVRRAGRVAEIDRVLERFVGQRAMVDHREHDRLVGLATEIEDGAVPGRVERRVRSRVRPVVLAPGVVARVDRGRRRRRDRVRVVEQARRLPRSRQVAGSDGGAEDEPGGIGEGVDAHMELAGAGADRKAQVGERLRARALERGRVVGIAGTRDEGRIRPSRSARAERTDGRETEAQRSWQSVERHALLLVVRAAIRPCGESDRGSCRAVGRCACPWCQAIPQAGGCSGASMSTPSPPHARFATAARPLQTSAQATRVQTITAPDGRSNSSAESASPSA